MDASPSQLPSPPLGALDECKMAPVVEKLGLGDAYRAHMRNRTKCVPSAQAPTQNPVRSASSASDNKVTGAAVAAAAGQINAPILTGVKGASNERVDQTASINLYITNADLKFPKIEMNASASSRHEINNNTRSPGQAAVPVIDATDITSGVKSSVLASKDTTEAKASITTEAASNGETRTTLASSATVIKITDRQAVTPPLTTEEFYTAFQEMTEETTRAYNKTSSLLSQYRRSPRQVKWRRCLQIHEASIRGRSSEVHKALFTGSSTKRRSKQLLKAALDRIHTRLFELQECIHLLRSQVETKSRDDGQDEKTHIETLPKRLNSWYKELLGAFEHYEKATDELIMRQILHPLPDNSLQKLFIDARASSRLKQCLCRVCPEECHGSHTAFLKLEPEIPDAVTNSLAGEVPPKEENPEAMWQCHMAFKSTVTRKETLIWLKVVSNITVSHLPLTVANSMSMSIDGPRGPEDGSNKLESEGMSHDRPLRKRRASSTPPEPAFKAQKMYPRQFHRHPDLAASSIELCPEFLTQHNATEHAVMKMVDNGGCDHSIYYLAEGERVAYGANNITLDDLLQKRHTQRYRTLLPKFSKLRLSRLIAEAVLRFDLRDSDPRPENSIYVHGLGLKGASRGGELPSLFINDHNLPALFLEITLKKQHESTSSPGVLANDNNGRGNGTTGRENVLVDLGMILLRISVESDDKLELKRVPSSLSGRRKFISENSGESKIGGHYSQVVRNCAWFFEGDEVMTDEQFRDKFFLEIVQPLKRLENSIN
ncbi:hypothetical protein F5B21DRAFT_75719 [Xylaria acuta]|nr:hypothetical protein F5B21DRAFT_75719 [Xylaria acuta]